MAKTVFVAVVEHKAGVNTYVGSTVEEREKKVADFCRQWADHEQVILHPAMTDTDVIEAYFEKVEHECVITGSDEVEL